MEGAWSDGRSFFKHKIYRSQDKQEGNEIIPPEWFFQEKDGKEAEYSERNNFLDGFELETIEPFLDTKTVGRYHKTIFKEGDPPADKNNFPERYILKFQMAIPGKGHEGIGNNE